MNNKECLFCQISLKKIPAYVLEENDYCLAFLDISPISNGHVLIITKRHYENLAQIEQVYWNNIMPIFKNLISKLKQTFSNIKGFNIISNMGTGAYQSIFHLHIHLVPKYKKAQGFIWNVKNDKNILKTEEVYKIMNNEKKFTK